MHAAKAVRRVRVIPYVRFVTMHSARVYARLAKSEIFDPAARQTSITTYKTAFISLDPSVWGRCRENATLEPGCFGRSLTNVHPLHPLRHRTILDWS